MAHLLSVYIREVLVNDGTPGHDELAMRLAKIQSCYDVRAGRAPSEHLTELVDGYNWLGRRNTKTEFSLNQNLSRNIVGALFQDYLTHLAFEFVHDWPSLFVFNEVSTTYGTYTLWKAGEPTQSEPSEKTDVAIGYILGADGVVNRQTARWPADVVTHLPPGSSIVPLLLVNSKVRISQSEFFDFMGRTMLMSKGHPHCLSTQAALRKEMDFDIVEAAQARDLFFLFGDGQEGNVRPRPKELARFLKVVRAHLGERMSSPDS
ncbi:MAG: hypothetical protein ACLQD8_01695 [Thermoplasmata archaeon]